MARKRKSDNNERSYNYSRNEANGSVGLSAEAQKALDTGTYGQLNTRKAQSYRSEDQAKIANPLPVLKGMAGSDNWESSFSRKNYVDTDRARRNYAQNHTPIGTKGLSQEDSDFLYKVFDRNRLSSGGNNAIVHQVKNNMWHNTNDWEQKYGKSVEQIVDEYSKDFEKKAERNDRAKGRQNKATSTINSILRGATVEPALDLESTILGKVAPKNELTNAVRNATEKYAKEKKQIKEGVTSNMGQVGKQAYEFGTNLAERGLQYVSPSKLKYALTLGKTAENERQNLKGRGIEGTNAEIQSGLAGLTDAALDVIGFESIPALKGLAESGNLGKEILGRFLIGGGEQGLTELINKGADRLFNGQNSLYDQKVASYMAQGMSEADAKKQANLDEATDLGESIVSGGLLNNVIGLGGRAVNNAINKIPELTSNAGKVGIIPEELQGFMGKPMSESTDNLQTPMGKANEIPRGIDSQSTSAPVNNADSPFRPDYQGVPTEYNEKYVEPEMMEHTLTGRTVSPEYATFVRKLESGEVKNIADLSDEYNAIPEIMEAKQRSGSGSTLSIDTPERKIKRGEILNDINHFGSAREYFDPVDNKMKVQYDGPVAREHRADFIIGLPSSGKSSAVVDPISNKYQSKLLDSDEVKKLIPEFDDGWGAGLVHEESKDILEYAKAAAFRNGENVVLPIVGHNPDSLRSEIARLKDIYGYKVYIHLNDLDSSKAAARNMRRFASQGRFLDLDSTSFKYGDKPRAVYEQLKKEGVADGYNKVSNDVRFGENPVQLEGTEVIPFDWRNNGSSGRTGGADSGAGSGKVPGGNVPTVENPEPFVKNNESMVEQPDMAALSESGDRVRSFSNRGAQDETLPDEIRNTLSEDYYRVLRNKDVEAKADTLFDPENLTQTRSNLDRAIQDHDPSAALLSYKLAKSYIDSGDYDAATDVIENVSAELTRMGQFTQAAKLAMMQNDPMAAMRSYMRDLDKLNQWGSKKYKGKWKNLELSQDDIDLINSVQKGDSEGLNAVIDQLNTKFGKQVPASLWDKAVALSKTSMLLNLRTQGRNIVANAAMLPVRSASDRMSAIGQNIAHKFNPDVKVTQSLTGGGKAEKSIAKQIWEREKSGILGENKMKDSVKSDILSKRQIFNDDFLGRFIDEKTNGGLQRLNERLGGTANKSTLETLQNVTYWLMGDFGDDPFVEKNFVNRLASYMKAQGIKNVDDVPDDAIAIATQEALKATFKDDNAFTKALSNVKKDSGKFGEIALPFVKTPANLAMRSIDYSPAGLVNTIRKAKSGAEVSAVIDELAKNLTGSAMIYLGYKLRKEGLLSGNYSDDADEKAWQKQHGMLENAIHVGDNYYTIDWAQPSATPIVLGSVLYDAFNDSEDSKKDVLNGVNSAYKSGLAVANSWLQTSPLQSVSEMLGGNSYSSGGPIDNVANEVIEFPQRFLPAQMGAIARTNDPVIRDTYIKDNSLTGILGNQARSAIAKVPGLSKSLPASYDTWGNERTRSDTKGEAFFAQNLNPGQLGNNNPTPLDDEIQRIYNATGNSEVFPLAADRSINFGNGESLTLTNKQHSEYQKNMGKRSYSYAESIMKNPDFQNLSDDEKAEVLSSAFKLSNDITKEEMFNHVTDNNKTIKEVARNGSADDVAKILLDKAKASALDMDLSTYQKKEAEYPGGVEQYLEDKQAAADLGFVTKSGTVQTDQYQKAISQAGPQSQKFINDLPVLQGLGLEKSAYYTYANAINEIPSLTPNEFAQTYKEINTNTANAITQKELLDYINSFDYDDPSEAEDLWYAYGGWTKKDGTPKKIKMENGVWKSYY